MSIWGKSLAVSVACFLVTVATLQKADAAMDPARLARIDGVVEQAIERGALPGAVVLVLHEGKVVYRKAYGSRCIQPTREAMTVDTVFDLASLTKPVATATSIFVLLEQGKLRLSDRVAEHWPEFGKNGKDRITLTHLLTHTGGLLADNALADYRDGKAEALRRITELKPLAAPGERFVYSDVGFIVLGELVERLGGMPLDQFARKHVFEPLGMNETGFRPGESLRRRAALTTQRDGEWLGGVVHDPRAAAMGGVAGHAGLFSTADDLATFARMMLGETDHPPLAPLTRQAMTTPRPVPGGLRTCGWDMQTGYSSNRGELFPSGVSFGHTGFTGTSIWIDPDSRTAVIFLSNRVHPNEKGNVTRLRGQVATLAAAALTNAAGSAQHTVLTGIDVLEREQFARLKGRRVGLVTNHSGRNRAGRSTIDLLHAAPDVKLVALFSPEHGIRGEVDMKVDDARDAKTGLPVYSLYGQRRKPTPETLKGIDTLVYDIQDAGCRFYTYISTLGLVMEAASENGLRLVVLDRPNPINGLAVEGPVLDTGSESFVAFHTLPVRHGMTVGELAKMFHTERKQGDGKPLTCELDVVPMEGWRRGDFFDATGLEWVNPSPNLRSPAAALLYPGIGLLETTNLSVGRGTDRPFEWIGAPWLDGQRLASELAQESLPGLRFVPAALTPQSSVFKGQRCGGVQILIDDWSRVRPLHTGLTLACTLHRLFPDAWKTERFNTLLGHWATFDGVRAGKSAASLERDWERERLKFLERRRVFLLYPE